MPKAGEEMMRHVGEHIRNIIDISTVACGSKTIHLTVTLGGTIKQHSDTFEHMIKRADDAMYEGKRLGRNRMIVW